MDRISSCMEETDYCMEDIDTCILLIPPWRVARASIIWEKFTSGSDGGTVWEDEATSGKATCIAAGISSSESSLRSYAFDFNKVCLLRGCFIFILGTLYTLIPDCRMIWVMRQLKGRPAVPSSRASAWLTEYACRDRKEGESEQHRQTGPSSISDYWAW
jgi:hypothetical protein